MSPRPGLDLIDELRLRSWARGNYVPKGQRSRDWHPVILEEMQRRDQEGTPTPQPALSYSMFSYFRRSRAIHPSQTQTPHFTQLAEGATASHEMHYT
jgi:hypothetical protein